MRLRFKSRCECCNETLPVNAECSGDNVGGRWRFLCEKCGSKIGTNETRKALEAISIWLCADDPGEVLDHEDYSILESLGMWPEHSSV